MNSESKQSLENIVVLLERISTQLERLESTLFVIEDLMREQKDIPVYDFTENPYQNRA